MIFGEYEWLNFFALRGLSEFCYYFGEYGSHRPISKR
jgi:hypothetical protein